MKRVRNGALIRIARSKLSCTDYNELMKRYTAVIAISAIVRNEQMYSLLVDRIVLHLTKNILLMLLLMLSPRRQKSGYGSSLAQSDHLPLLEEARRRRRR